LKVNGTFESQWKSFERVKYGQIMLHLTRKLQRTGPGLFKACCDSCWEPRPLQNACVGATCDVRTVLRTVLGSDSDNSDGSRTRSVRRSAMQHRGEEFVFHAGSFRISKSKQVTLARCLLHTCLTLASHVKCFLSGIGFRHL